MAVGDLTSEQADSKKLIKDMSAMVGSLVEKTNDMLDCGEGTDCYNKKERDRLKLILNSKEENLKTAPLQKSLAEKNLFVFEKGEDGYNEMIYDRFSNTAVEFKQNSIKKQQHYMQNIAQVLKQYQSEVLFAKRTEELYDTKEKTYIKKKKDLDRLEGMVRTSERKVVYENKDMDGLYLARRVMQFFYYSAIIIYIVFGDFIPKKQYKDYSVISIIVILLLLPVMLNILVKWLFILKDYFYYWFKDIPHKDVYLDL